MKWGQFQKKINILSSAIPQEDQITGRLNITITKSLIGLLFDLLLCYIYNIHNIYA